MAKTKRKKRSNASDSDNSLNTSKYFKSGCIPENTDTTVIVSDVLKETNSVLYECGTSKKTDSNIEDSVFECHTSTPLSKGTSAKMAGNNKKSPGKILNGSDMTEKQQLVFLVQAVTDIKLGQDNLKKMFESTLDKLKSELITNIDTKVRALKDELSIDIAKETSRIGDVLPSVHAMNNRINVLEQSIPAKDNGASANGDYDGSFVIHGTPLDDPNRTVTASGIQVTDPEDLLKIIQNLVNFLGEEIRSTARVTSAKRLPAKFHVRPPIIKFSLPTLDRKILYLISR
ncbi:hypothetical protein ACF0H5_019507 [Mactra antiquata]